MRLAAQAAAEATRDLQALERESTDSHLCSANEVRGYHVEATDGTLGHVEDFLFDEQSWAIHRIVIDTRNFLPGKHVVIEPGWIDEVDWAQRTVHAKVSRERIEQSPEYRPGSQPIMHPIDGP